MLTELPYGLPGRIYRSPMPYSDRDPGGRLFQAYQEAGVSVVALLSEPWEWVERAEFDLAAFYQEQGLEVLHLPIPDFGIPSLEALEGLVETIVDRARQGRHVVIHCYAGIGRTGLVAACLACRVLGLPPWEAMAWVRCYIHGAVESLEQREIVFQYCARRRFQTASKDARPSSKEGEP